MPGTDRRSAARPIGLPPGIDYEAAGQDAKKYETSNPVVRRLIDRLMRSLAAQLQAAPGAIVDVGVGEGLAAERAFAGRRPVIGLEYRADKVRCARDRLPALAPVVADAGLLPVRTGGAPVATCLEVLEHLTEPQRAVAELARITSGTCIVSVPWEPWFRLGNLARGKNVSRWGNDVEHIQRYDPRSLHRLLAVSFGDVEVHRCFPWLIGVARRPHRSAVA